MQRSKLSRGIAAVFAICTTVALFSAVASLANVESAVVQARAAIPAQALALNAHTTPR